MSADLPSPELSAGARGSATVGELEKIEVLLDAAGIDDHHGGGGESYYRYSTAYRVENALAYKKMFEESEQHCERLNGAIRYLLSRWKRSGGSSPNVERTHGARKEGL